MKKYTGYKDGTNSRGLLSITRQPPEHFASCVTSSEDWATSFQQKCKEATDLINQFISEGRLAAPFWNKSGGSMGKKRKKALSTFTEIKATSRQYAKYRNKTGLTYHFSNQERALKYIQDLTL